MTTSIDSSDTQAAAPSPCSKSDPEGVTTVLVVDDEELVRMCAVEMLSDAGFVVLQADCSREALTQLQRHPEVNVLFTDINMPGTLDGLELARQVHTLRPDVQLILTSGRMRPSKAELGDSDFVAKPYRDAEVTALIRTTRRIQPRV